jgi:hypothetical protein
VYGVNRCGSSGQARESTDEKGLYLTPTIEAKANDLAAEIADAKAASATAIEAAKSAIAQFSKERAKCVDSYSKMDGDTLSKFSSYCLKLDIEYAALYQKIFALSALPSETTDQANSKTDTANAYAENADSLVAQMQDITELLIAATLAALEPKKVTITCVKGKLTKKVSAVKPKCPSGYKVKK